jgi:ankyrin repeat protein
MLESLGTDLTVICPLRRTVVHALVLSDADHALPKLLSLKTIDVNARDYEGKTALHMAINRKNGVLIPMLLEHGADPKIKDNNDESCYGLAERLGIGLNIKKRSRSGSCSSPTKKNKTD